MPNILAIPTAIEVLRQAKTQSPRARVIFPGHDRGVQIDTAIEILFDKGIQNDSVITRKETPRSTGVYRLLNGSTLGTDSPLFFLHVPRDFQAG